MILSVKHKCKNNKLTSANYFRASYFGKTKRFQEGKILYIERFHYGPTTQIIEKHRKFNKLTHVENGFDRVDRNMFWKVLKVWG